VPVGRSSGPDLCSHAEVTMTVAEATSDKNPRIRGPTYKRTAQGANAAPPLRSASPPD
jgi:hypothetical protein